MTRHLGQLRWPDLAGTGDGDEDRSDLLLAVPTGSCEQHGPHLPLDTDTLIASALANHLASRMADVLVAPPFAIGASGEHAGFPGTLSIGTDALTSALVEVARSALPPSTSGADQPFAAVLFVNGHGGNAEALAETVRLLRSEGRRASAWHPSIPGGDPHAGETETSLMLHLHPESVRMDLAEAGSTARFSELGDKLRSEGLASVTPNGVLGDPTGATEEHGRTLFAGLLDDLVGAAAELVGAADH